MTLSVLVVAKNEHSFMLPPPTGFTQATVIKE